MALQVDGLARLVLQVRFVAAKKIRRPILISTLGSNFVA
jgi:hypothetical protein